MVAAAAVGEEELAARIPAAADNRDEAAARDLVDGEEVVAVAAEVDLPDATATFVILGRSTPAVVVAAEAIRQHCYQHGVVPCTAVADTAVVAGTLPVAAAADLAGRCH